MNLTFLTPLGSIAALLFALYLTAKVLKADKGSKEVQDIGFFSGLSGFIGMNIATAANCRTAAAANKSLNGGLKVAFHAGAVMGFVVVGLGLLDISIWFFFLKYWYSNPAHLVLEAGQSLENAQIRSITSAMLTFGMGASSMALFARVGGGIFTKAADVGADLVGKVEIGIPEDDPRNPAVIADNVGDNVGDVAGMGADLYESYVGSVISTAALAAAAGLGFNSVMIPMVLAGIGILASIIGSFFVRTKEGADQKQLLGALRHGVWISGLLIAAAAYLLIRFGLGRGYSGVYFAVLSGLAAGVLIGLSTEYFTSDSYRPTRKLAKSALTGPGTTIISGLSLGMLSAAVPILIIAASVLVSYFAAGGAASYNMGLYGIGLSAVGMLSTLGITLATDAYGPIADNAGGIAEMVYMGEEVRTRTDALDSLGNTTAATGKGFAIGSAALTALALIASYVEQVKVLRPDFAFNLSVTNPPVLTGLFIGGMLPFLFAASTMDSVGRVAQSIVLEVRRQFRDIAGLMEGRTEPDYAKCVDICTRSAQKEMLLPAIAAVAAPIITGLILGVNGVVGMLAGAAVTGFLLAVVMANAGGAWDNAKKFIEKGEYGGKGSEAHKAAVVGDTVGDPFKDTSGPSINILMKLLSMVSIVFAGFILSFSII